MARPAQLALSVSEIRYYLRMTEPHTHLFEVEVRAIENPGSTNWVMPSWTPGSYLLREFPRHVQQFGATDGAGNPLAWSKTDKGRWRVEPAPDGTVIVRYAVYANELTVRTSHLDATHAYVNGASVFMYLDGSRDGPLSLQLETPPEWHTTTALRPGGGAPNHFRADSYDEMVDSPLEIGTHPELAFEIDGRPHHIAVWGRGNLDPERLAADAERIVRTASEFWGGLPYDRYVFLLHLLPGGQGGLEHRRSCSLQADRWAFRGRPYEQFLGLVAHEFFHVWNGTRIRPAPLERVDFTRENYTRALWIVEGWTTYYTELILRRAGIITPERYIERLGEAIARLQTLPGRNVQSLAESSFDTWIKFYRPDEHTPNAQISYYHKGALVALLLDLQIRGETGNRRSLDDVMRRLWEQYGTRDIGYPEAPGEGAEAIASEVCGEDLSEFFDTYVRGTAELDYDRFLGAAGLRLETPSADETEDERGRTRTGGAPARAAEPVASTAAANAQATLGMALREHNSQIIVGHVLAGSPAYRAGVNARDQLVALSGIRATLPTLAARIAEIAPGDPATLTVLRRGELVTMHLDVVTPPPPQPRIVRIAAPTAEQEVVYRDWLAVAQPTVGSAEP